MTVSEVAEFLHVHRMTVYSLMAAGQLHGFKVGRRWRFNRSEIIAFTKKPRA
jgi:excisionase family DNA binding protein